MSVFEQQERTPDTDVSTEEWEVPTDDRRAAGEGRGASDEDPGAPQPAGAHKPSFAMGFRGYRRREVDDYVEDVSRVIEELERPHLADAAVERALEEVGEETSAILKRAHEAEEAITVRAEVRAAKRTRSAEEESRAMREEAEARVRELDDDMGLLWRERHRLLEDMERLFNQVGRVMAAANRRFPPPGRPEPGERSASFDDGPAPEDGVPAASDGVPAPLDDGRVPLADEQPQDGGGPTLEDDGPPPEASALHDAPDPDGSAIAAQRAGSDERPSVAGLGEPFLLEEPSEYRPPAQIG